MGTHVETPDSQIISRAGEQFLRRLALPVPGAWLEKLLMLERLECVYSEARRGADGGPMFGPLLAALGISCECAAEDLARIPARGPVVVVANHPFGLLEGPVLGELLLRVRPDVCFLANSVLSMAPELREYVIPVDPFGGRAAVRENRQPLRRCLAWLEAGGLLVVFPAGEVSSLQLRRLKVEDPPWNATTARLIRRTGATTVPVFLHGGNGAGFQTAGLLHPRLRTALLAREFLNKRGKTVRVAIGSPVSAARMAGHATEREAIEYLRRRAHSLRWQCAGGAGPALVRARPAAPVVDAQDPAVLRREVQSLPSSQRLLEAGGLAAYLAEARQIPQTLREIGRLREITFRLAGEGTRRALDLDRFDSHYQHLFVWNEERSEVVGAYRLAQTDRVLESMGTAGLYTASLFRLRPELFLELGPTIELGRSFVRPEYQRSYLPLLLLWRGIGQVVLRNPECRRLFGPVSISGVYSAAAREIMVSFLKGKCLEQRMGRHVRPRHGFRPRPLVASEIQGLTAPMDGLDDLCDVVADIEPGRRSIPVLLRQYLNVGGRFLGFNMDRDFSGVVDGLVVVDLPRTNPRALQRYLGKEGAERFLDYHATAVGRG